MKQGGQDHFGPNSCHDFAIKKFVGSLHVARPASGPKSGQLSGPGGLPPGINHIPAMTLAKCFPWIKR